MIQSSQSGTPVRLNQLIQERASAVKRYLVNEAGVEADRAVVESAAINDASNTFSGAELGLSHYGECIGVYSNFSPQLTQW